MMKVKKKRGEIQMFRDMDYHKADVKRPTEEDAVVRFYVMLNVIVTFKGRPTYEIDPKVLHLKIMQPLEMAFYKVFQACVNYPCTRHLTDLVPFICHQVLSDEVEKLHTALGIKSDGSDARRASRDYHSSLLTISTFQESRMKIYEDTITRFFSMLEFYTPFAMRPKIWNPQTIPKEYWMEKIHTPLREAFQTFISVMRNFPTKISKQKLLVDYTLDHILPNCRTGMSLRGLRFELTRKLDRNKSINHSEVSVWTPEEDDMKHALELHKKALSLPSSSEEAQKALENYDKIYRRASSAVVNEMKDRTYAGKTIHYNPLSRSNTLLQYLVVADAHHGDELVHKVMDRKSIKQNKKVNLLVPEGQSSDNITQESKLSDKLRLFQSQDSMSPVPVVSECVVRPTSAESNKSKEGQKDYQLLASEPETTMMFHRPSTGYPHIHKRYRPGKPSVVMRMESNVLQMLRKPTNSVKDLIIYETDNALGILQSEN